MKRMWLQTFGIGVAMTTNLVAQSPDSTTSREVISATGCVQRAGADATGEGIGSSFVLKGVRVAPAVGLLEAPRPTPRAPLSDRDDQARASDAAARTEPGASQDAAPDMPIAREAIVPRDTGMLLVADRGVELEPHLGHRVLVTGRLSSFAAAGGVASTASGRTLTVTKLAVIAPACTTGS